MSAPSSSQSTQQLNLGNKPGNWIQFWCEGCPSLEVSDLAVHKKFQRTVRILHLQGRTGDTVSSSRWARSKAPLARVTVQQREAPGFPWAQPEAPGFPRAQRGSRLSLSTERLQAFPEHSKALSCSLSRACLPHSAALVTAQHRTSVHQLSVAVTDSAKQKH